MKQVFISYRRGSGLYLAKNIATYLNSRGYRVFFDYDSIENGVFDKQIFKAIENSTDFILVLTEGALDKCGNADDWVRSEVMCAKRHNKNIILVTDAERFKEYPDSLPSDLDFLRFIDWTPIHPKLFEGSMQILMKRIKARTSYRRFFTIAALFLLSLIIAIGVYLYVPMKTTTAYIDGDENYPIAIFEEFDREENVEDFNELFPKEVEVFFVRTSSADRQKQLIIDVELFEEMDADAYGVSQEQLEAAIQTMSGFTVREYYQSVKKSIRKTQLSLTENFSPIEYSTGNFDWLIYRFYDSDTNKETWRMSAKVTDVAYINVVLTEDEMNFLKEKRFIINLKRMLDKMDSVLMNYVMEEFCY